MPHGDFFWVFVARVFYYAAVSVQSFFLYYLGDLPSGLPPSLPPDRALLATVFTAQLGALLSALPAGRYTDLYGRKHLVKWCCLLCGCMYIGWGTMPRIESVLTISFFYGVGNGAFLVVDYALACDVLPSDADTAKDMGLWGVACFLGFSMGPCLCAPLLEYVGNKAIAGATAHYSQTGYALILAFGCLNFFASALVVNLIRGSR